MTARDKRRLLVDATLIGVVLTLLVAAADALGWLTPLERWFYDQRALLCQHWMPRPTDRLVHVDIDDPSNDEIGNWPWSRTDIADILDELRLAEPKAVGLDILFSEPQKSGGEVDPEEALAGAIRKLDNCIVAASFPFRREQVGPLYAAVRDVLLGDPELTEERVVAVLREKSYSQPDLPAAVHAEYLGARRDALSRRIRQARDAGAAADEETLRNKLLPHAAVLNTAAANAFREEFARVKAVDALGRLSIPAPAARPPLVKGELRHAPLAPIGAAAAAGGFVDYPQFADGKVRAVPLLLEYDGKVYPQLGLALAWRMLGVDPSRLRFEGGDVVVPRGKLPDLRVPVRTLRAGELLGQKQDLPLSVSAAWFGRSDDWARMYDPPGYRVPRQHLPITALWDAVQIRRRIRANNQFADQFTRELAPDSLVAEYDRSLPPDDIEGINGRIDKLLPLVELPPADDPKRKEAEGKVATLRGVREENPKLREKLANHRADLRAVLSGKAVLVGWTATGVAADFLPTSLHSHCPGVVLHGVMFNQILTGEVWRTLPPWVTLLVTLLVGGLATLAVSFLSPAKALASAALLVVGYLLVNGYLLFDYGNLILGAAGPVVAVGVVFTGATAAKLVVERWERARITRRLGSYVDPKLRDYVLKHPEQSLFEGQIREMTVVFCDVAGFTKLTETRGSETVAILNELWGVVVPAIKQHDGLINKFMGDGIMFFYGAPDQSPHQARDAVAAVLAVRKAVERFNAEVAPSRDWPALGMRCGVSTGNMIVGDAGHTTNPSEIRADYTVLGDNVNLGSRLEAANKAVGTAALVTERTYELSRDAGILFRPVGKLCVVGKSTGVMTYEPMALLDDATEQQKELASATKRVVDSFMAGKPAECLEAITRMESAHGRSKLTDLYRERCEWFLREPTPEPFDCQIVLTEK
jgi:CHASE2 domain-containing sensor protein/class 3 adenylate cyclase